MADILGERVARLEVTTENHERRLEAVEEDNKTLLEKVNAISIRWTVLMTGGATLGAAILNLLIAVIAKKIGVS